jgi:hypothetical protein
MRVALNDAAPLYRDAPEVRAVRQSGEDAMHAFMRELLPAAPDARRVLAAGLFMDTLSAVGKQFSERPRSAREIEVYADALADMLCAWLAQWGAPA